MVEEKVFNEAKEEASELGWELLEIRKISDILEDHYLYITLVRRVGPGDYATHIYNTSLGGFHVGRYDMKDLEEARKDYLSRR